MDSSSPWPWLALGLVLTLTPVPILLPGRVKYRTMEYLDIARRNGSWGRVWRNALLLPSNWLDLIRGFGGTWCLLHALELIRVSRAYPAFSSPWMVGVGAVSIVTVGLVLMMAIFRNDDGAMAPVALVTAVCLAATPLQIGGFALILAFSTMVAFKSFAFFFLVMSLAVVGLGYLFGQLFIGIFVGGFAATPMLLAFFSNRELAIGLRQSGTVRKPPPAR